MENFYKIKLNDGIGVIVNKGYKKNTYDVKGYYTNNNEFTDSDLKKIITNDLKNIADMYLKEFIEKNLNNKDFFKEKENLINIICSNDSEKLLYLEINYDYIINNILIINSNGTEIEYNIKTKAYQINDNKNIFSFMTLFYTYHYIYKKLINKQIENNIAYSSILVAIEINKFLKNKKSVTIKYNNEIKKYKDSIVSTTYLFDIINNNLNLSRYRLDYPEQTKNIKEITLKHGRQILKITTGLNAKYEYFKT